MYGCGPCCKMSLSPVGNKPILLTVILFFWPEIMDKFQNTLYSLREVSHQANAIRRVR